MSSATLTTHANAGAQSERVSIRRLLWAGPLTAVVAAVANIIVREIGALLGTVPSDLVFLTVPSVAIATIVQVLLGAVVFTVIARFARRPVRVFRIVAVAALLLSFLNPIMAGMGVFPPGVSIGLETVLTMIVMHIVAGAITIVLLPALARDR